MGNMLLDDVTTSLAVWVPPPRKAPAVSGHASRGIAQGGFLSACWLLVVQQPIWQPTRSMTLMRPSAVDGLELCVEGVEGTSRGLCVGEPHRSEVPQSVQAFSATVLSERNAPCWGCPAVLSSQGPHRPDLRSTIEDQTETVPNPSQGCKGRRPRIDARTSVRMQSWLTPVGWPAGQLLA